MILLRYSPVLVALVFIGCAQLSYQEQRDPRPKPAVLHQYELAVVDGLGNHMEGALIEYTLRDGERVIKNDTLTTTFYGVLRVALPVMENPVYSYISTYKSSFEYKVTKAGYSAVSGVLSSDYGDERSFDGPVKRGKVALIRHVEHQYELVVADIDGDYLEGVLIDYTLKDGERVVKNSLFTTSPDGILKETLPVSRDSQHTYVCMYRSSLEYRASIDGYYPVRGVLSSDYGSDLSLDVLPTKTERIEMLTPADYFSEQFASSMSDIVLKSRILAFLDVIILQSMWTESNLITHSIDLVSFKNRDYLRFGFANTNVYNSLKLSKYDVARELFDEVVRKVLSPLNEHIGDSDLFFGYDLRVLGYTKDFADEYSFAKAIEFRFMIPEEIARKYKSKDISGQRLLDSSIILMDDERIELKLQ